MRAAYVRWTPSHIKALIVPYPITGHMDVVKEFQDDEAPLALGENAADSEVDEEPVQDSDSESEMHEDEAPDEEHGCSLGEGTSQSCLGEGRALNLTHDQAKIAGELQQKLSVYEKAKELMDSIGDRSVAMVMARTIHAEHRKAAGHLQRDPSIAQALNDQLREEFQEDTRKRIEYTKAREAEAEARKAKQEATAAKRQLTAARAKLKETQSLHECGETLKRFSPKMLGDECAHGGPNHCRQARFEVLERLLAHGNALTPQQKNDWPWFKREWDAKMAAAHDKTWGSKFAGYMQNLVEELEKGNASAVTDFMCNETMRVLNDVPTLQV